MNRVVLSLAIALATAFAPLSIAQETSPAANAFHKLQSLVGNWEGKDDSGSPVKTKFQLVAGNTAVMETLTMPGMEEMLTLYSVDGDGIALLHYCPTNNQPHMRAVPPAGEIKELGFEFQGATNLPNLSMGHEQKLVLEFHDKNHITEHWTWRKNGKDTEMTYSLVRNPA